MSDVSSKIDDLKDLIQELVVEMRVDQQKIETIDKKFEYFAPKTGLDSLENNIRLNVVQPVKDDLNDVEEIARSNSKWIKWISGFVTTIAVAIVVELIGRAMP